MTTPALLGSHNIVAFVVASNAERAKSFYRDTLGLRLVAEELPFALVFDANGIMLRVGIAQEVTPVNYTVLGWHVPDIANMIQNLHKAGVKFERFEGRKQDELGIWTAPTGAKVAWFRDPDGNYLSLTQF
jgi:catechol 2,3-dioxygenase-like lactoylglutathione lyase family enzyme